MRKLASALPVALAALAATPASAAESLSLGGYFLSPPAAPEASPQPGARGFGDGVVVFTPRIAGFQLGSVEVGLGGAGPDDGRFAIGAPGGRDWAAGASLGWIGFTLSGAVESGEQDRLGLNLKYDVGAWSLSMGGGRASQEEAAGGETRQLQLELGASYTFGPGVLSSFGLQTYAPGDDALVLDEGDAVYLTGGLKLRF